MESAYWPDPSKIRWDMPVPTCATHGMRRLHAKVGKPVFCWVLSDHLESIPCHFWRGHTQPCVGVDQGCEACALGWQADWKGYLAALPYAAQHVRLVEITPYAAKTLPALVDRKASLRGRKLKLERDGMFENSPVVASFLGYQAVPERYPNPDVKAALLRIWRGGARRAAQREQPPAADQGGEEVDHEAL